jgi:hypothetical protein
MTRGSTLVLRSNGGDFGSVLLGDDGVSWASRFSALIPLSFGSARWPARIALNSDMSSFWLALSRP